MRLCGISERGLDGLSVLGLSGKWYFIAVSVKMAHLVYRYATWNGFRMQWFFNWLSALGFRILMVTVSVKRVGWQQCILFA